MSHHCGDGPCPMPPHPDLLARINQARNNENQTPLGTGLAAHLLEERLSSPTGRIPGLNDGTIFPESHFAGQESQRPLADRMSSAALERTPLRGAIQYLTMNSIFKYQTADYYSVAVVLVDFSDKVMQPGAAQSLKTLFFSTGEIETKSVTEYFQTVSNGRVSIVGDVVGPYRMPQKLAYYANGGFGKAGAFPNVRNLAADAVAATKKDGKLNFTAYDNDKNGYVDAFVVVHAGAGGEVTGDTNDLWSLKWTLPQEEVINDVKVYAFLTIPEDAKIGVCAHELGHLVFGWPDLYDTDNPKTDIVSAGIGNWCLMAGGSWNHLAGNARGTTPAHPSAWCKAQQNWINLEIQTGNTPLTLPDVKAKGNKVIRLWTNGDVDATSKEYFLLENRQQIDFDEALPGNGALIWHVDDTIPDNRDEKHPKVKLMQADSLDQLALANAGRGDAGDPFPGTTKNTSFTFTTNPSSKEYTGRNSSVEVTNISASGPHMKMNVAVRAFVRVYKQGEPGPAGGIGGYDLSSPADRVFAFNGDATFSLNQLVLYRPGSGICWVLENNGGSYTPTFKSSSGIGGFDLRSSNDLALAFDYNTADYYREKADHLIFYRPGKGAIFIIKRSGATYTAVYSQGQDGSGIGGYNLSSEHDRIIPFDWNQTGKRDHLLIYRPGSGILWVIRNYHRLGPGGKFEPVFQTSTGVAGFDLANTSDLAFAFDYTGSQRQDHLALYRPGSGMFCCLRRSGEGFSTVVRVPAGAGIGGYSLSSPSDRIFPFDWNGTKKLDHLVFYRPGSRIFWVLRNKRTGQDQPDAGFEAVFTSTSGVGGYDLSSTDDEAFAFDANKDSKLNDLVLYRRNGTGTISVVNDR